MNVYIRKIEKLKSHFWKTYTVTKERERLQHLYRVRGDVSSTAAMGDYKSAMGSYNFEFAKK